MGEESKYYIEGRLVKYMLNLQWSEFQWKNYIRFFESFQRESFYTLSDYVGMQWLITTMYFGIFQLSSLTALRL